MSGKTARMPLLGLAALAVAGVAFGIFVTRTSSPLPELELVFQFIVVFAFGFLYC